jgi:hypothetical protein
VRARREGNKGANTHPLNASANLSQAGFMLLQCPHQGARNFTNAPFPAMPSVARDVEVRVGRGEVEGGGQRRMTAQRQIHSALRCNHTHVGRNNTTSHRFGHGGTSIWTAIVRAATVQRTRTNHRRTVTHEARRACMRAHQTEISRGGEQPVGTRFAAHLQGWSKRGERSSPTRCDER